MQLRRRPHISHTMIMPVRTLGMSAHSSQAHTIHHLPSSSKSPGQIESYLLHSSDASGGGRVHTALQLPSSGKSPGEIQPCPPSNASPSGGEFAAYPLHNTGSSDGSRGQQRTNIGRVQDALGITSSLETIKREQEDSLCVSIAQDIQRLEVRVRSGICNQCVRCAARSWHFLSCACLPGRMLCCYGNRSARAWWLCCRHAAPRGVPATGHQCWLVLQRQK